MPFRDTFDCLWCGMPHATRDRQDLEGWTQLCPACLARAGANPFLRARLKAGLEARATAAGRVQPSAPPTPAPTEAATGSRDLGPARLSLAPPPARAPGTAGPSSARQEQGASPAALHAGPARPGSPFGPGASPDLQDDFYLRRGAYQRGPVHDTAWSAELDAAGRWLDALPLHGEIVELAAGTGWWGTLLAGRGTLSLLDESVVRLERARDRLVAHRLRAHLHPRDRWAPPDRQVESLVLGPAVADIPSVRLPAFAALVHAWLRPGGVLAVIDLLPEAFATSSGAAFGRAHEATALPSALAQAGFTSIETGTTGRLFTLLRAVA